MNGSDFADFSDRGRRWWARGAFALAVAAAAVPVLFAGVLGAVALLVVEIGGVVVTARHH